MLFEITSNYSSNALFLGQVVKGNETSDLEIPQGALLTITNIALADAKGKFAKFRYFSNYFTDSETAIVNLLVEMEDDENEKVETKTFQIAKLVAGKSDQLRVQVRLFSHEDSKIAVRGSGSVHITGYLAPDPNFPDVSPFAKFKRILILNRMMTSIVKTKKLYANKS